MEEIKEAIIKDKAVVCPICGKLNARLTGFETIRNFKVRCRGSNGRLEHFFMLNVEKEKNK